MRKINFSKDVFPHLIAVLIFLVVTLFFFSPFFFENKILSQHDIKEASGLSKTIIDYRSATGEEGLWAESAFGGMPSYLISLKWSNGPVSALERIYTIFIQHPVNKIFAAFLGFYLLLLAFGVRPWLAISGALAFGLSSYMIIGMTAGHNARISAIAYIPLTMAGIHLAFSGRKVWGFCLTSLGLALELKSNHLQITYYLLLIVLVYGLVQLIFAIKNRTLPDYIKSLVLLIPAALIAIGSFSGQLWAVQEYTKYSIRGASELLAPGEKQASDGLPKSYAFAYKYGLWEPMTLLIPKFYGGGSDNDNGDQEGGVAYKALVAAAQSGQERNPNQLAQYTSPYWGPQGGTLGPYYGGAIIVFLFILGIMIADKKYVWWLVPLAILSWLLSVGDSLPSFNYWMFDHFPGYNKFRSFSFGLVIILFCMPLLGFLGLERLLQTGITKETKRKLLIAFSITGGLCLFYFIFAGWLDYISDNEKSLPGWFITALIEDRSGMLRSDAFRSFAFIGLVFVVLYFDIIKRISVNYFFVFLGVLILIDLTVVDRRHFGKNNFQRSLQETFSPTPADQEILKDKSYYRVYDLGNQGDPMADARASYFHHSLGGYHGAKLHRYKEFYDSAVMKDYMKLARDLRSQKLSLDNYTIFNMLNTKYIILSPEAQNVVLNTSAYGNAWFVKRVDNVNSPTEELKKIAEVNPREVAIIDASKIKISQINYDSSSKIALVEHTPPHLKYESESSVNGLAVFSEIYYPKGWTATIDGKKSPILQADYILRALEVPAGKHTIEFTFSPKPYVIGNKIIMCSSWLLLFVVLGGIGYSLKKETV